jgi:5-methylcytosine-specific restriction protein B
MARAQWCGEEIYAAAARWRVDCLVGDGSLFVAGARLWTRETADAVRETIGTVDPSAGTFTGKLVDHLTGAEPDVIRMAAELVCMLLLAEVDTGGPKRREHLGAILALVPGSESIPPSILGAIDGGGVASFAQARNRRDVHLRFLIRLVCAIKALTAAEREVALGDPWRFREFVDRVRNPADAMQANAVLHLLFPDTFEYMVSEVHRRKLIAAFGAAPGVAQAANSDRKLEVIRALAAEGIGDAAELNFYAEAFKRVWFEPASTRWQEAVSWAQQIYDHPGFDGSERTYKLELGELVATAADLARCRRPPGACTAPCESVATHGGCRPKVGPAAAGHRSVRRGF